ncbi:hypothetical protein [Streptomyces chilikensis]|uniref:hypothetical protein n=1 Tax=Streptomyces chilikensis TaxID=1194079 RepID=UPI000AD027C7|nr:hypothetical protein [Streptomyces chilikensis]
MRLDADRHEVRVLHERWENRSASNANAQYGRGSAPAVFRRWKTEQGSHGERRRVETYRLDTREMTDPLKNAVLAAEWTWRGVLRL